MMTGAEALIESLKRQQVTEIFGYARSNNLSCCGCGKAFSDPLYIGTDGAERRSHGFGICAGQW